MSDQEHRTFKTFTLQIKGPAKANDKQRSRVDAQLRSLTEAAEEDMTDLLPEGWRAQIRPFPWRDEGGAE
jgi:phosphoribosyl-dephospho-CoA transferase